MTVAEEAVLLAEAVEASVAVSLAAVFVDEVVAEAVETVLQAVEAVETVEAVEVEAKLGDLLGRYLAPIILKADSSHASVRVKARAGRWFFP
ncbi:hypothetical protein ACQKWADRAFT_312799 [Trichoderma austrokoningii]